MGLGGVISNLLSLGAKLLPVVSASANAPSSSLSPQVESNQIETELKALMRLLERIKATLYDAEEREIRDRSVKLWLKELKEVANDAEDVLDEYHYEVLRWQVESRDTSASPNSRKRKQIQVPDGMLDQIQLIRSKFAEIAKDRIALQLPEEEAPRRYNSDMQIASTSPFVEESDIIGRKSEKEKLLNLLSSESHDGEMISVVTIVGTGGIGKTTLAQLVYNDRGIRQKFDKIGWVCVSEDFNVQRLTREVFESITGMSCGLTNLSALQEKIIKEIERKRVFLVFDDVWNENRNHWELFRRPFKSASLLKILVTTRNKHVAQIMQTVPTFNLGYLSKEQSWQIFHHYAFGGAIQNMGSNLVGIGKQIMKKCGMLPLAIKSIASLLRHEPKEESWRDILENELWKSDANNEIFQPLQISYTCLPTYLKPCFLYCSMFPKDYRYSAKKLVKLWISQGYVQTDGLKSAQEIGWEYAKALWQRSFFQGSYREKKFYFTLHDMVHDLAQFNSGHGCYSIVGDMVPNFPKEIFHLYLGGRIKLEVTPPSTIEKFDTLRTLIVMDNRGKKICSSFGISKAPKLRALHLLSRNDLYFDFSFVKSKHLRYLCLDGIGFEKLPECVCFLYNLQSLTLRECFDLIELPKKIGNLISLEELTIKRCDQLRMLPVSIGQLKALRKLRLCDCSELEELPCDMENLTNLQVLTIIDTSVNSLPPGMYKFLSRIRELEVRVRCNTVGWLKHLVDLEGTLILTGLNCVRSLNDVRCANLPSMHNLERLTLSGAQTFYVRDIIARQSVLELFIDGNGDASPETDTNEDGYEIIDYSLMVWLQPHPNCKELEIECYYNCLFPFWIGNSILCASLERIELSCCLNITFLPFGSLGKLKYLRIFGCSSLQFIQEESLPLVLEEIKISCCRSLISVMGLRTLKFLFILHITKCRNLVLLDPCRKASVVTIFWECPKLQVWRSQHDISYEVFHIMSHLLYGKYIEETIFGLLNEYAYFIREESYKLLEIQSIMLLHHGESCEVDLEELTIKSYSGLMSPDWIGDPTICASLERIEVLDCLYITLPFGSLEKLKYLRILGCSSLEYINEESLPLVVEELEISYCENLTYVNGLQRLKSLVKLDIAYCRNLCWLDPFGKISIITISECPKIRELCAQHDIYYKRSESDNYSGNTPRDGDEYHSHDICND